MAPVFLCVSDLFCVLRIMAPVFHNAAHTSRAACVGVGYYFSKVMAHCGGYVKERVCSEIVFNRLLC